MDTAPGMDHRPVIRRIARVSLATALLAAVAACSESGTGPGTAPTIITELPRALTPSETAVSRAGNTFALDLLREVAQAEPGGNLFLSPLSASMALGMAMAGAGGDTFDQMRSTLGFPDLTREEIGEAYRGLITLLRELDPAVEFEIANSVWAREGFPIRQSFLDFVAESFDARAQVLDFDDPGAAGVINSWVAERTQNRIPTIVDPPIDPEMVMFLINAIHFKGEWTDRFPAANTRSEPFRGLDGVRSVSLMRREGTFGYRSTPEYAAVDLPYGGTAFSMTVVLPGEGRDITEFLGSLDETEWAGFASGFGQGEGTVFLPRFTMEFRRSLGDDLQALGMTDAFVPGLANFGEMSPDPRLYISEVLQKTFVAVDEEGTEAAAATSVGIGVTSAPVPFTFRADRPFLFLLREKLSGTILFVGVIRDAP